MENNIILIRGLPGVGKSTVANIILENWNFKLLNSDEIRKRVYRNPSFSEDEINSIYQIIANKTEELLENNNSVVLDATYYKKELIEQIKEIADKYQANLLILEVKIPDEDIVKKRLAIRYQKSDNKQISTYNTYLKVLNNFERIAFNTFQIDNISDKKILAKRSKNY